MSLLSDSYCAEALAAERKEGDFLGALCLASVDETWHVTTVSRQVRPSQLVFDPRSGGGCRTGPFVFSSQVPCTLGGVVSDTLVSSYYAPARSWTAEVLPQGDDIGLC